MDGPASAKWKHSVFMIWVWNLLRTKTSGESEVHNNWFVCTYTLDRSTLLVISDQEMEEGKCDVWHDSERVVKFQIFSCWPDNGSNKFSSHLKPWRNLYFANERRRTAAFWKHNVAVLGKLIATKNLTGICTRNYSLLEMESR